MRNPLFETSLNSFGFHVPPASHKGSESLKTSRHQKETVRGLNGNTQALDKASKHTFTNNMYGPEGEQNKILTQCSQSYIKNVSTTTHTKASHKNIQTVAHKQTYSSKVSSKHEQQKKDISYTRIMEKLQAKEKIIKELKKLSEINLTNKLKLSYRIDKRSLADCSNQLNTDRIMTPKVTKCNLNQSFVYNSPKCQENNNYESLKNSYDKDKYKKNKNPQDLHLTQPYHYSNTNGKLKHKNTIDNSRDLMDLSYSNNYYSSHSHILSTVTPPRADIKTKYAEKITSPSPKDDSVKSKFTIYDFIIGKSLGEGKFGTVYQAIHKKSKFLLVLKKISKASIKSNFMIDQFLLQIKLQSFCDHENIVKLYGFFQDREYVYLILEYMQEGTLFKMLKKTKTVSEQYASKRLKEVASAIKYLHEKGIVHRDIKPENIVISHGTGKLCDFGWAAICNGRRKTYCGTFDYTAPEILQGVEYDLTVDLWCLGILAYELLVGRAPFYHHSRKQTMKKILNVESAALEFPSSLSKNAVCFMQNLIRRKPEQRMMAQDVLKHPFLTQTQKQ